MSSGKILGAVLDESAGALPGVTIVVRNLETGVSRETVTNTRGRFEVPGLQPGRYQVEAELAGFSRFSQGPVSVQVNEESLVNISLKVGQLAETINVVGQGLIVQTTTATLGKVIEEKQILELPLSGRNFTALGLLTPGVTTRGQSTSDAAYVVHGQRQDSNNFQLDGVANVSLGGNTVQARPNVDAVQEFKIQTSNFSAEFGRNSGSVVQVVTKSGTNSFRGSVWEFLRDDKFQAKNFFATSEPPPLQQNQFGGTFGGPVTIPGLYSGRNRTFFFGAFEGFRLTRGLTRQAVVATAAERAGNFSFLSRPIRRSADRAAVPRQYHSGQSHQPRRAAAADADAAAEHRRRRAAAEQLRLVARRRSRRSTSTCCASITRSTRSGTCSIATSFRTTPTSTRSRARARPAIWGSRPRATRARSMRRSPSTPRCRARSSTSCGWAARATTTSA